ncbi:MAG: right-handed parallel beta-helix repeat-containing protein [Oceanipulchritudo sp.]
MKSLLALYAICLTLSPLLAERVYPRQESTPLDPTLVTPVEIDEASIVRVIYVDVNHPEASDANTGYLASLPKKTIASAIDQAFGAIEASNSGAKIFIKNGRYASPAQRAANRLSSSRQKEQPLVIEGESRGGVIIDCTRVIAPGQIEDLGDGLYGIPWMENRGHGTFAWKNGPDSFGGEVAHRSETVFVDGVRLRPVILEPHNGELVGNNVYWTYIPASYRGREGVTRPGTFGVSEIEENMVFFRPPEGVSMEGAEVRVNVLGSFLDLREKSNLVFRNLVIVGPGQFAGDAVIKNFGASGLDRVENILIEDVEIYSPSSGDGIAISNAINFTVRRVIVRDSGGNGYSGTRVDNLFLEDVDFSENNWRSEMGDIMRWVAGGWKMLESTDILLNRYVAYGNGASGFWFDTAVRNATLRELYAVGNSVFGFYNEKCVGDIHVADGVFMNNGRYGIFNAETGNSLIENNISFNNGDSAFGLRCRDNWNTVGEILLLPQDIVLRNNLFVSRFPDGNLIYSYEIGALQQYLDTFIATFSGSGNQYWSPIFPNAFQVDGAVTFDNWLQAIPEGEDAGSVFQDPKIDTTGDGLAHFFLFEDMSADNVGQLGDNESFNGFRPNLENARPVLDMPLNWRKGAGLEVHFMLNAPQSGDYTFTLNANVPAALYGSTDESLYRVSAVPLAESGTASTFRDWEDAGNGSVTLQLAAGEFYHMVIRSALPETTDMPFLSLGWTAPWMGANEVRPLAAPYIRTPEILPPSIDGFLQAASREVDGSFQLEGFGRFWDLGLSYRYHAVHGILYVPDFQGLPGFWGYSVNLGWTYFNQVYGESWLYSQTKQSWLYSPGWGGEVAFYYVYSGPEAGWASYPR